MLKALARKAYSKLPHSSFRFLDRSCLELNSIEELKKLMNWKEDGILHRTDLDEVTSISDLNQRRLRDAECIATVIRNACKTAALEIGTSDGRTTLLMSKNAPQAKIHTVNILPEDIESNAGGKLVTWALTKEQIGAVYREAKVDNVEQIYANTLSWKPKIGTVDVAFIDGCHDTDFVISDTELVLPFVKKGGFILWHDFNPSLTNKFHWIHSVCKAIDILYAKKVLTNPTFHTKDSWTGIYQVPR